MGEAWRARHGRGAWPAAGCLPATHTPANTPSPCPVRPLPLHLQHGLRLLKQLLGLRPHGLVIEDLGVAAVGVAAAQLPHLHGTGCERGAPQRLHKGGYAADQLQPCCWLDRSDCKLADHSAHAMQSCFARMPSLPRQRGHHVPGRTDSCRSASGEGGMSCQKQRPCARIAFI